MINDQRSLDCALFCCKAYREWLKHERSVRETVKLKIGPILFSKGFKHQNIFNSDMTIPFSVAVFNEMSFI